MYTPARMLVVLVFAALVPAGSSPRAQDVPLRADTIRGATFSDAVIAEAFGLPHATEAHVALARETMRCMQTEDAILCNLTAPGRSWNDCASTALVGQFIVWFDMLGGRRTDKRVYVAVDCPEATVTVSSRRGFPATEFTLATRPKDSVEEASRTVVFIQTETD